MFKNTLKLRRYFSTGINKIENYKTFPSLIKQKEMMEKYNLPKHETRTFQKKQLSPIKIDNEFFILNINMGHNYGILSNSLMKNMMFHLKHYETNSFLQTFLLQNFEDSIFSFGTDFSFLKHKLANGEYTDIKEYFNLLYKFNHFLTTFPKPFLLQTEGVIANSAIGSYGLLPFAFSKGNTTLWFNSIDFNFTPHGGEIFLLKNLPNEIGTYLALTGGKLKTGDLLKYGIIKDLIDFDDNNIDILKRNTKSDALFNGYDCYEPVYKHVFSKRKDTEMKINEFFERSEKENPKEVLLDLYYRKKMIENANLIKLEQTENIGMMKEENLEQIKIENNHFWFDHYFLKDLKTKTKKFFDSAIENNLDKISSIFSKNSIEEIIVALEEDGSEFAIKTMAKLKTKNHNILAITLKMIRESRNLTYVECMQMEYNVMTQLIENENLRSNLFKKEKGDSSSEGSEVQIEVKNNKRDDFILNDHLNDFAPVKFYYEEFPEAFLCYFNKVDLRNIHQFENYASVVKSSLFRWGIDYMNPSFDRESIKRQIQLYYRLEKKKEDQIERIISLLESREKQKKYIEDRKQTVNDFLSSENFFEILNNLLNTVFDDKFKENQKMIGESNLKFSTFLKSRMNKDLKDAFIRTRLSHKKNPELMNSKFGNDDDFPIEINSDRFTLSEKTKQNMNFDKLKRKYVKNASISDDNLESFVKGTMPSDKLETEIIKLNDEEIYYNANSIVEKEKVKYKRKDFEFNKDFAYYLHENGIIKPELEFRKNLVNNLQILYEKFAAKMNNKDRMQFFEFLRNEFFVDYEEIKDLRKITENSIYKFFDFKKKIKDVDMVKLELDKENFIFQLKEEKIDFKEIEKIENSLSEDKINSIKDFLFLGQSSNLKDPDNRLFQLLTQTDFLQPEHKKLFEKISELKDNEFFSNFLNYLEVFYLEKSKEIEIEIISSSEGLFKGYVDKNLSMELQNIILPHVLYKGFKQFLKAFQSIYDNIKNGLMHPHSDESKEEIIFNILTSSGFNQIKSKEDIREILNSLDFLILTGLEIYHENSEKLIFEEDKLEKKLEDYLINIKDKLAINDNIGTVVDFINEKNDHFKVSNIDKFKQFHLDFQEIKDLMKKKNFALIDFKFEDHMNKFSSSFKTLFIDETGKDVVDSKKRKNTLMNNYNRFLHVFSELNNYFKSKQILIDIDPFSNFRDFYQDIKNQYLSGYYNCQTDIKKKINSLKENQDEIYSEKNSRVLKTGIDALIIRLEKLNKLSLHDRSAGFDDFYKDITEESSFIPDCYSEFDYRQNANDWLQMKLYSFIRNIFEYREKLERKLNDERLYQLDCQISNILQKQNIESFLMEMLQNEEYLIKKMGNDFSMFKEDIKSRQNDIDSIRLKREEKNFDEEKFKKYYSMMMGHSMNKNSSMLESIFFSKHLNDILEEKPKKEEKLQIQKEIQIENVLLKENLEYFDYNEFCIESFKIMKEKEADNKFVDLSDNLRKDITYVADKFKIYE